MSTNMGNLEKLGILVIVILVVVVGVVAITPKSAVDDGRLYGGEETAAAPQEPEELVPPSGDGKTPPDVWPLPVDGKSANADPAVAPPLANNGGGALPAVQPAATTPGFRIVKVQKNETLASIAKRELGSSTRYQEIIDANPGISPTKLKIGMELKIPVAGSTQAVAVAPQQQPANAPGVTPPVMPPAPPVSAAERTYVVKSGDTLSSIAAAQLGSSKRWPEIAKASEGTLHGSTKLSVGMTLTIPSGAASATTSGDPVPATESANTPPAAGEHEYTVKSGDSWWLIAKNEMGSESFMKDLLAANGAKASSALNVGSKIKIPAH